MSVPEPETKKVGAGGPMVPCIGRCRRSVLRQGSCRAEGPTRGCGVLRKYDCAQRALECNDVCVLPWGPQGTGFSVLSPVCFCYRRTEGPVASESFRCWNTRNLRLWICSAARAKESHSRDSRSYSIELVQPLFRDRETETGTGVGRRCAGSRK